MTVAEQLNDVWEYWKIRRKNARVEIRCAG